jgi:hypothetical protein
MNRSIRTTILLLFLPTVLLANAMDFESAPWLRPRVIENFKSLMNRSPFSLPTAEETAPVADRFFLTGMATIDKKPVVFVFDKNTQNRLMLSKLEGPENQSKDMLLEVFQSPEPKNLRASVQIEGQRTEIHFSETAFSGPPGEPMPYQPGAPGQPMQPPPPQQPPPPHQQDNAHQPTAQPGTNSNSQPPRRVIRRRVISGEPPAAQPVPGQ